jgi:hypothetical protein
MIDLKQVSSAYGRCGCYLLSGKDWNVVRFEPVNIIQCLAYIAITFCQGFHILIYIYLFIVKM